MTNTFGANWKLNPVTIDKAKDLLDSYANEGLSGLVDTEIIVFVPYIFISDLKRLIDEKGYTFRLGAQNVSEHECGAFSGQISAAMLASVGVTEFLIGHSERRGGYEEKVVHSQDIMIEKIRQSVNVIDEATIKAAKTEAIEYTNEMLGRKISTIVEYNKHQWERQEQNQNEKPLLLRPLTALYCIGETLEEKAEGKTLTVLEKQLEKGLAKISSDDLKYVIIAYEPRWAIGTGKSANPNDIKEAHLMIRSLTRSDIKILYGGSMKPDTASEIMAIKGVNGGLIGGASLNAQDFSKIVKYHSK
ncbi:triosephosphate isomerase [Candidatus Woesearchaeota archaeon]|nr:triosephosphate isomerase [Candidatus Woesearchaeota archaeon]